MRGNTQVAEHRTDYPGETVRKHIENDMEKYPDKYSKQECNNLVICDAACK